MPTIHQEVDSFAEFVKQKVPSQDARPSLEECLRLWREEQELEETIAAIKRSEKDFAEGRFMSIEEAGRRIRENLGCPSLDK